jgi:hypothetical protein
MPENQLRFCFERIVPLAYANVAAERALAENPDNGSPLGPEAAGVRSKFWQPGRQLRITFLDGVPKVQQKVEQFARQWMDYANIVFDFGEYSDADIRISFQQNGSWSALGTDALVEEYFPKNEPTMNYGWLTPDSLDQDYARVVLHEFGHALGLIHEHQNPANKIQWNRAAVIRDLSGPPNNWDEATIEHNVLRRYNRGQTQFTRFDDKSIMLYAFPSHWTLNNMEFPENSALSETDKEFIADRYPKEKQALSDQSVGR